MQIGINDLYAVKTKISSSYFRYFSIFNKNLNYQDFYNSIWLSGFDESLDPDPESGWGTSVHQTVYPLSGKNHEIVPKNVRGYLLNSTCNSVVSDGNAFCPTLIGNQNVRNGDIVLASVYCYVSPDYDGNTVKLYSDGATYGKTVSFYYCDNVNDSSSLDQYASFQADESFGQSTQKLKTIYSPNLFENGNFDEGLKNWSSNADSTTHQLINTPFGKGIRVTRTNGNGGYWSLRYIGRKIIYHSEHNYQIKFKYRVLKGDGIPFRVGFWVYDAFQEYYSADLPISVKELGNGWFEALCQYKFVGTYFDLPNIINSFNDNSVVEFTDIELRDLSYENSLPMYLDQVEDVGDQVRGEWKKLSIYAYCNEGIAPVFLYISKNGSSNFSQLKGYVIFAFPKYEIIRKNDTSGIKKMQSFNFGNSETKGIEGIDLIWKNQILNKTSFFPYLSLRSFQKDDFIRKISSKIISEDTTYYPYMSTIKLDTIDNKLISDRLSRWQFAIEIFIHEFNLREKIFGSGFNFLNWFGYSFLKSRYASDYPHNPFLSVLLYSGLIGLILYGFFIMKVIYYYIRYHKEFYTFSILFLVTFFFSFFSSGGPFDPPVMGFFCIIPFLIHSIYSKEKK